MKVSFTHLIAWAIVEAAQEWPVDGRAYAESDGKPQAIEPGGGQSRDRGRRRAQGRLAQPDGAVHQGRRRARLRGFHAYYEDLINKTRENKLTADDFQGTNDHAHQPGRARDGRLGAAPDGRPGNDRRHRLDRLPGRVGPRPAGQAQGARRLEGDDDDVDLRPPDHPGRRVGLVPAPDRPAAPGRGRLLRVGRPRRSACTPSVVTNAYPASASAPPLGSGGASPSAGAAPPGHRAAPGRPGGDLAAQGLPHPRPPRGPPRPARQGARRAIPRSSRRTST